MSIKIRLIIILALFGLTYFLMQVTGTAKTVPIKKSLSLFPKQIGEWSFVDSHKLSDATIKMLGVDDYIDYNYVSKDGMKINFYASFFSSVGTTGGYHSPRNCLPGGGWGIADLSTLKLRLHSPKKPATINSMITRKGPDRQIILYWFQNRGRIINSEYWDKIYTVLDAIFKQRRDGSFIRIIAPTTKDNIKNTEDALKKFAEEAMVILEDYLPGKKI